MKTKIQKEKRKRWERKYPEKVLKQLRKWIAKETDPKELERAKRILRHYTQKEKLKKD